ncbi:MAG TPA: hypothetical protein PK988_10085 [Candidatus Sumerlaeota bacterium]|nr:hypothetical protein [Candidatus Sumerlaeota bacterium]
MGVQAFRMLSLPRLCGDKDAIHCGEMESPPDEEFDHRGEAEVFQYPSHDAARVCFGEFIETISQPALEIVGFIQPHPIRCQGDKSESGLPKQLLIFLLGEGLLVDSRSTKFHQAIMLFFPLGITIARPEAFANIDENSAGFQNARNLPKCFLRVCEVVQCGTNERKVQGVVGNGK